MAAEVTATWLQQGLDALLWDACGSLRTDRPRVRKQMAWHTTTVFAPLGPRLQKLGHSPRLLPSPFTAPICPAPYHCPSRSFPSDRRDIPAPHGPGQARPRLPLPTRFGSRSPRRRRRAAPRGPLPRLPPGTPARHQCRSPGAYRWLRCCLCGLVRHRAGGCGSGGGGCSCGGGVGGLATPTTS